MYRFASITTDENIYDDIDGKVIITQVTEGGVSDRAGLRVGDVITAVNGTQIEDRFEANDYLVRGRGGEVLEYTILRNGKQMVLHVTTADYGLPLYFIALTFTAVGFLLCGAWVFLRRTQYPVARLFGWTMLTAGAVLLFSKDVSFHHYPDALTTIGYFLQPIAWAVMIGSFMHLFLYFPVPRFVKPVPPMYITLMYVLPISVMFVARIAVQILAPKGSWGFALFILFFIVVTIVQVALKKQFKNFESVEYRQRNRLVIAAIVLGIIFLGGGTTVTTFGGWQIVFFIGIGIPGLLFLAIAQQRIFDLYVVVRKSSVYSVLSTGFVVLLVLSALTLLYVLPIQDAFLPVVRITSRQVEVISIQALDADHRAVFERRLYFTFGLALMALLWWLYRKGRGFLDVRFYRGTYDYKRVLSAFSKLSHSFSDRLSLADSVVHDLVNLMHLKSAVFLSRSNGKFIPLADNRLRSDTESMVLTSHDLKTLASYFEKGSSIAANNLPMRERFKSLDVEFLTAVKSENTIEALLLLGEKQAETNYSREDIELLDNLATNVGDALTTMEFYEGAREKERLRKELEIARRIQLASLPAEIPDLPGIDVAAHSFPAHEVGGDFYEFLPRHDSTTFIIGDVSGKGTSAAMYLARIQGIIKTIESYQPMLWELFVRLNTLIFDHIEKQSYLTMAGLRVDFLRNEVRFLRAGHLPLIHYNALNREVTLHQPPGMGIGLDRHLFSEELKEETIFVRGGDVFVLVSDGVTEAENAEHMQLDIDGVSRCVIEHAGESAQNILEAIFAVVGEYTGAAERRDDATVLVVKFSIPHTS
jgi:serine phosphatase RsbU (regulator of sigma subunit)